MTEWSLYEIERWRKGGTRRLDVPPLISINSGATYATLMSFSFRNHKHGDHIYLPGYCQDQLIKMYLREPGTGLSETLGVLCPQGASFCSHKSYLFFTILYMGESFTAHPCPRHTGNFHFPVSLQSGSVTWLVLTHRLRMQVVSRPKHLIFIARPSPCGNQRNHGEAVKGRITKLLCGGQLPWKVSPLALDLHEQDTNVCCFKTLRCWGCFSAVWPGLSYAQFLLEVASNSLFPYWTRNQKTKVELLALLLP